MSSLPTGFFQSKVLGLKEIEMSTDEKLRNLPYARRAMIQEGARFLVNELKRNVHVWEKRKTGTHMRDTIGILQAGPDSVRVIVPKPYAQAENAREGTKPGHGPHNFADRSEDALANYWRTRIFSTYYNLLKKGSYGSGV